MVESLMTQELPTIRRSPSVDVRTVALSLMWVWLPTTTAVVDNDRSAEGLAHEGVEPVEADPGSAVSGQADVPEEAAVEAMAETTHEASGPVDVFVTNVGLTIDETFGTMIRWGGETVRDVNLDSVCNCTKAFFGEIRVSDPGAPGPSRWSWPPRDQPPLVSPSGSSRPTCS